MKIDRARAQKAFADYAAHYNAADAKVKLKIDHTYRVAALCARIAQSLALPPEDVDLAWLSGILHDVGRFEQLRRYNTFIDAQSVSHAALSVAVLFDEGRIRDYLDDAGADALLRTAVEWHSAFRLPEALDDRTRLFCQILRDADKIDILRVNVETPMEEIYNVSTAALRRSPVTPAVLDAFYAHHCVLPLCRLHSGAFVYGRWLLSKSKYDEQFLVIAGQLAVCRHAEIAGVRFLSVYQQHGRANLAAVLQDRHLQERQRGRHAPAAVGVQTAGMVSFIISPHWNML